MTLDEGEQYFDRSHAKVIWSKVHHWDFHVFERLCDDHTLVISSIVQHDDRLVSPLTINCVHVFTQLHNKVEKGVSIG